MLGARTDTSAFLTIKRISDGVNDDGARVCPSCRDAGAGSARPPRCVGLAERRDPGGGRRPGRGAGWHLLVVRLAIATKRSRRPLASAIARTGSQRRRPDGSAKHGQRLGALDASTPPVNAPSSRRAAPPCRKHVSTARRPQRAPPRRRITAGRQHHGVTRRVPGTPSPRVASKMLSHRQGRP